MKQKALDKVALAAACKAVVKQTLWRGPKPQSVDDIADTDQISRLAAAYQEIALRHLEFIEDQKRDPNMLTRAIEYLAEGHAIPPMKDDTRWFDEMLTALIELACPNFIHSKPATAFFKDIEQGIEVARKTAE